MYGECTKEELRRRVSRGHGKYVVQINGKNKYWSERVGRQRDECYRKVAGTGKIRDTSATGVSIGGQGVIDIGLDRQINRITAITTIAQRHPLCEKYV